MSLVNMNFQSQYLGGNTEITVILPDKPWEEEPKKFYDRKKKYPVLWLLHCTYGDHTDWLRKSNIEVYACEKDLIVVCPSGMNANYANWPNFGTGYAMYDFFFEELMPLIYGWFPASDKREDNFIAGLSMGARGTCVYAFSHPEKFAAAAALSGTPRNFATMPEREPEMWARMEKASHNYENMEAFLNSPENTWKIVTEKAGTGELPRLYFACGEDDMLYQAFLDFREYAKEIGLDATFESIPGYRHEWRFWDLTIQKALSFFGMDRMDAGNPY